MEARVADGRTPAQIEADIVRRREDLATALDELAVRVHPSTLAADAKARALSAVDRTAGRAYVAANRAVGRARDFFTTEEGAPRLDRVVPAAVGAVAVVALVAGLSRRRRRR
jgi:MYXO-CTERM domain-containing protein